MATFVLVHGAWHGAWCWHKLSAELRSRGHTVVAPDLPGHGIDRTPASEVTLASYAARVADVLDEHQPLAFLQQAVRTGRSPRANTLKTRAGRASNCCSGGWPRLRAAASARSPERCV